MVIYGAAIWDPVQLLSRFHSPVTVIISLVAILLATLNVNIGANVVSPANDFSNLWPRRISFKISGVITCIMGIAMMPWKLLANYDTFVVAWLGGYAAVLGSVAGIMICDYYLIRRRTLVTNDLYLRGGQYEYAKGFNWRAIGALAVGSAVALMGLVISSVRFLYDYSWFVGFAVALAWAESRTRSPQIHDPAPRRRSWSRRPRARRPDPHSAEHRSQHRPAGHDRPDAGLGVCRELPAAGRVGYGGRTGRIAGVAKSSYRHRRCAAGAEREWGPAAMVLSGRTT
jgi:hypothetical protein